MSSFSILIVDDEPNILKSLGRLFFQEEDIEVFTAEDAQKGAAILNSQPIDLVISDERMPRVEGYEFIRFVKKKYPHIIRMILTGYADTDTIIKAVNQGEVYRYLTKPWDDNELLITVRRALEHGKTECEKEHLTHELQKKNIELSDFNKKLEEMVKKRTAELEKAVAIIKTSRNQAKADFQETVNLLNSIITLFQHDIGKFSRKTAGLTEQICLIMELKDDEISRIVIAAYLQDLGLVGDNREKNVLEEKHTVIGETLLSSVMKLPEIGKIVRHHHEHYNGTGKPDGLKEDAIPLGSRIIFAAGMYVKMVTQKKSSNDAISFILQHSGTLFDPQVGTVLSSIAKGSEGSHYIAVTISELKEGMILVSDIYLDNGVLFMPSKTIITSEIVDRIHHFSGSLPLQKEIYVSLGGVNEPNKCH